MGRAARRLARAAPRIGAGDVEIAQRRIAEVVRRRGVGEHHLGHQLGAAVGRYRRERRVLADRQRFRRAVDRGGRGEDEVPDPALDRRLDQRRATCTVLLR